MALGSLRSKRDTSLSALERLCLPDPSSPPSPLSPVFPYALALSRLVPSRVAVNWCGTISQPLTRIPAKTFAF